MAALVGLAACQSGGSNKASQSAAPKTHADSLMDDIMAGHDEGMGKMGRIMATEKKVQAALDSLAKLPAAARKAAAGYQARLDSLKQGLGMAQDAMNRWMDTFSMDTLAGDLEKRTRYLETEKQKIQEVGQQMRQWLDRADSLIRP